MKHLFALAPLLLREGAGLAGVGLVSYGAWLAYHPAGFIAAGMLLIFGALRVARADAIAEGTDNQ